MEKTQILLVQVHLIYSLNLFFYKYLFKSPLEKADISAFNLFTFLRFILYKVFLKHGPYCSALFNTFYNCLVICLL